MSKPSLNDKERKLDKYIGHQVRRTVPPLYSIRPSRDFSVRILATITDYEQRRHRLTLVGLTLLAVSPIVLRQLWLILRQDYFSVAQWPLGNLLTWSYNLFVISSLALYLAIVSGTVTAGTLYYLRNQRLRDDERNEAGEPAPEGAR